MLRKFVLPLVIALVALVASPALAVTYYAVTGIAKNASGTALVSPSILVTVTTTGATATIYSDGAGASQVNPFTAGADGAYSFFVTSGRYTITATKSGSSYATFITRPVPGAGSGGTTATDVTCSDCVALGSETTGGYAASSTEGGAATTATALAADPADCSAGQVATGIAASGALTCTATPTLTTVTAALTGNASTATALAADPADCSAGQVATGIAASGALSCTATPTVTTVQGVLIGGGADDADSGLVRGTNNVDLVCAEKATTGTDSCIKYGATDNWTIGVAGTTRLSVTAAALNFTSSSTTDHELTLDGFAFGPGTQGSAAGWTFYGSGSEDAITTSGYMISSANVLGFNNGNPGSTTAKPQGQMSGGQTKTLTDNSATAFVRLTMSSGSTIGGRVLYQVGATDATDFQSRSGLMVFSAVNKAGTITCTVSNPLAISEEEVVAVSTGTLTNNGFTCADAGTNLLALSANMDSSLSGPTVTMKYTVEVIGVQGTLLVTPQ